MKSMKIVGVLIAFLSGVPLVLSVTSGGEKFFDKVTTRIKDNYLNNLPRANKFGDSNSCTVSDTEDCSLTNFSKDETTLVYPGGETRCIFSDSTPFAFQVIPGDSDKLLFYFQGGGACWDELSTKLGFCTTDAKPEDLEGIFDRSDERNDYKAHTVVNVLYCSGDVHGGNVTRPYNDDTGVPVQQMGLANAQSALDWVVQQQQSGALTTTFSELVVMGCSAGSIGAQLWGKQVLTTLPWKTAAVVPDSYAGVFPEGSVGPLVYNYGMCDSGFLSDDLYQKCINQELEMQDIVLEFASATPTVPYAFIQSKLDIVQQSYYWALEFTVQVDTGNHSQPIFITPAEYYQKTNDVFALYNAQLPNFITYLVDGGQHCFTPYSLLYTTDPTDPSGGGADTDAELLNDWVDRMPLSNEEDIDTVCVGEVKDTTETQQLQQQKQKLGVEDNTYCSAEVVPKQFVEQY